jgi:CHAD domain-containing protein/CYTH domain-containing protein
MEPVGVSPALLAGPAASGVGELARTLVDQVRAARLRLDTPGDPEALHDFRVALRRIRSLLRAYRRDTHGLAGRRLRRGLRRIARVTNASRDLEVKLAWLTAQAPTLRPRDRVGLRWLIRRLEASKQEADARASDRITSDLEDLLEELDRRGRERAAEPGSGEPTLAQVTGERLERFAQALRRRLEGVRSIADQRQGHRARIAGKRVRYLLEPLSSALPPAADLVIQLKSLQDHLGEMHDADVLARAIATAMEDAAAERGQRVAARLREGAPLDRAALRRERRRDPMPGLLTLATRAQERRERAWAEVEREWLGRWEERILGPAAELARRLAVGSAAPAGVEIERKYLLQSLPPRVLEAPVEEIEQGYLPGERIQERVRQVRRGDQVRWYRTLKRGEGLVREEMEEETSAAFFEAVWPLTEGRRVRKRRFRVEDNGLVWEVDAFTDRALVLAEVELETPDRGAEPPEWLAPYVVREVTGEAEFLNVNLAR